MDNIKQVLSDSGAFAVAGAFVLVDGQYGSTGKGLASSVLAECFHDRVELVLSNAGPNSGHTSYHGDAKVVLTQLPTFSVMAKKHGSDIRTRMTAGAVIDPPKLRHEYMQHGMKRVEIHPNAAVVTLDATRMEEEMKGRIGSTGKGTGAALARKVMREPEATINTTLWHESVSRMLDCGITVMRAGENPIPYIKLVEVSQGFSLSLNASPFYPYCTSRDCTVAQAMSDAGLHPNDLHRSMMVIRTYPIRVGGNSGPCYPDQREIKWADISVEPETTTVTGKERRLFTFSRQQFMDAVRFNRPDYLFVNFLNYLTRDEHDKFSAALVRDYFAIMGRKPRAILGGHGPYNSDVEVLQHG